MLEFLTYAYNAKNRPRPPMTNNSSILKTRLRAVSLLLWNSTGKNAKKKWAWSTSCERPSCDLFLLWLALLMQLRPSSLVDHVRFFPVRSSRETARSLFENENLLKNLSSQIFQLSTVFYNNLLSLAWKKLCSYKRVFTVYASESKIEKKNKLHQYCTKVIDTVPFRGRGVLL